MNNSEEIPNDTNRINNENNEDLNQNFVQENINRGQEDQSPEQFQQSFPIEQNNHSPDDNSFHIDKKIDDFSRDEKFVKKEKEISEKLDRIFGGESVISVSSFSKNIFMINKILFLTTFAEFLFQRFDAVTLFLTIVIIFIELEIFSKKHLYKWLIVLLCSVLLDAFVLIDISPVRKKI